VNDITTDDIRYIAGLSKLELTDEEIEKFQAELAKIVSYVERLGDAELGDLETTAQVSGLVNQMREDAVADPKASDNSLQRATREQLLENTVDATDAGYIKVNKVL